MMWKRVVGLVFALGALVAAEGQAQVAWDSPLLTPPQPTRGVGIFVIDAAYGDVGALATWQGTGPLGYRIGMAEDWSGDVSVFGGVDVKGTLARASSEFPLDISWVAGAGLAFADDVLVTFPLGLSAGHTFDADGVRFTPYLTPRVLLDAYIGGGSNLDLRFATDLGIDIAFHPSWTIRFGTTFGSRRRDGLAIGIVF
jgi:hypothetical protein